MSYDSLWPRSNLTPGQPTEPTGLGLQKSLKLGDVTLSELLCAVSPILLSIQILIYVPQTVKFEIGRGLFENLENSKSDLPNFWKFENFQMNDALNFKIGLGETIFDSR